MLASLWLAVVVERPFSYVFYTCYFQLTVYCEGEVVTGCPVRIRALPDLSQIMFSGIDPCAIGSIVEVLVRSSSFFKKENWFLIIINFNQQINSNGAGGGALEVEAKSPTDRILNCPVSNENGVYTATFQPDEAGEWKISVTYEGEHIQGSPFTCFVFDPHAVKVLFLCFSIKYFPLFLFHAAIVWLFENENLFPIDRGTHLLWSVLCTFPRKFHVFLNRQPSPKTVAY